MQQDPSLTSASSFWKNLSSAASVCRAARTIDREVVRGEKAAGPEVSACLALSLIKSLSPL
jgi:hypothetical protein